MAMHVAVDIDPRGADRVLPAIPHASSLCIHTGNIINRGFIYRQSANATEEIKITCTKAIKKWISAIDKHETKNLTDVDIDYGKLVNSQQMTESRKNLKLTVKLFVVNSGPECVKEALNLVGEKLRTRHVETLILSLPGTAYGGSFTYGGLIGAFWEAAEMQTDFTFNDLAHHTECHVGAPSVEDWSFQQGAELANGDSSQEGPRGGSGPVSDDSRGASFSTSRDVHISWTIGLADLDAKSLKDVYDHATEKPALDQIGSDACCSPPEDLVALCKEKDIQLLSHNDPREILSEEALFEILSANFDHKKDLIGWRVGWVVRYSAVVKCRGIIHTKGYIVNLIRDLPPI